MTRNPLSSVDGVEDVAAELKQVIDMADAGARATSGSAAQSDEMGDKTMASSSTQQEEVKSSLALVVVETELAENVDVTNQSSVTSGGKDQQVVASKSGDDEDLSETNQTNDSSNTFTSSYSSGR